MKKHKRKHGRGAPMLLLARSAFGDLGAKRLFCRVARSAFSDLVE